MSKIKDIARMAELLELLDSQKNRSSPFMDDCCKLGVSGRSTRRRGLHGELRCPLLRLLRQVRLTAHPPQRLSAIHEVDRKRRRYPAYRDQNFVRKAVARRGRRVSCHRCGWQGTRAA